MRSGDKRVTSLVSSRIVPLSGQQVEQRGLSGAVRTENGVQPPFGKRDAHVVDDRIAAEAFREAGRGEDDGMIRRHRALRLPDIQAEPLVNRSSNPPGR
jgi:hypothetical protein